MLTNFCHSPPGVLNICLSQSSSVPTKLWSPLPQVNTSTTPFISQLETSTTIFEGHTRMCSFWLDFYQSLKVTGVLSLFLMLMPMTGSQKDTNTEEFHDFKQHLFHSCLRTILKKLEQCMTKWDIVRCTNNHFCWVIDGIGPYIADYPKQVLVAGIMNSWCPVYVISLLAILSCFQNYRCDGPSTNLNTANAEPWMWEKAERLLETKSNDEL